MTTLDPYLSPQGRLSLRAYQRKTERLGVPQTEDALRAFVWATFGARIPDVPVCLHHTTPWRAFADAYFARAPVSVWKAARGFGGKSFLLALLGMTEAITLGAYVTILGGSGEQSNRVHEYMRQAWQKPSMPAYLLASDPSKRETHLTNGGLIQALTASSRSVRGPHSSRLRLDEVDEMELAIFEAAQGQPMGTPTTPKQTVISSTHHYVRRTMTIALERAYENGWLIAEWCWRESLQPHGWLAQSEVDTKRNEVTAQMWATEYELQRPSLSNLVFPDFGEANITDAEPDLSLPIELAVDDGFMDPRVILFVQRTGTRILVFDEMYHSRHLEETCVQEVVNRCIKFSGQEKPEDFDALSLEKRAEWCRKNKVLLPEIVCGSPEAKSLQLYFKKADMVFRFITHKVIDGLGIVRKHICDGQGYRTLQVNRRCKNLIWEMTEGYQYPPLDRRSVDEKPADGNDHCCDALRYWAYVRARR